MNVFPADQKSARWLDINFEFLHFFSKWTFDCLYPCFEYQQRYKFSSIIILIISMIISMTNVRCMIRNVYIFARFRIIYYILVLIYYRLLMIGKPRLLQILFVTFFWGIYLSLILHDFVLSGTYMNFPLTVSLFLYLQLRKAWPFLL